MSDLLFVKYYTSLFASPELDVSDEIGEIERNEPVILIESPKPRYSFARVLTKNGLGWVNVNDLTADR